MTNTILIVDDTEENIDILVDLLCDDYELLVALNGKKALELAQKNKPDVILLDVMMPEMSGFEVCTILKSIPDTMHIPILFLTALSDAEDEVRGIEAGAVDFIRKPFNPVIVQSRIKNNITSKNYQDVLEELVKERTSKIEQTKEVIIKSMGVIAEYRDPETGGHIRRTQNYVRAIANHLKKNPKHAKYLTDDKIYSLYKSAPLHDLGKVSIPDHILLKPGKLTMEEFDIMKGHTTSGKEAIETIMYDLPDEQFLKHALEIAYCHHERWNGSGYPCGLKGEEIPLSARIMALADVYDALINKRVYKPAFTHEKAIEMIMEGRSTHFDPEIIDVLVEIQHQFTQISKDYSDEKSE